MATNNQYVRVRVATMNRETKCLDVQIQDYDTEVNPLLVVLREIRQLFNDTGHDIISLSSKNISLQEFEEGRRGMS